MANSLTKSGNSVCETLKASQQRYASQIGCSSWRYLCLWISQRKCCSVSRRIGNSIKISPHLKTPQVERQAQTKTWLKPTHIYNLIPSRARVCQWKIATSGRDRGKPRKTLLDESTLLRPQVLNESWLLIYPWQVPDDRWQLKWKVSWQPFVAHVSYLNLDL